MSPYVWWALTPPSHPCLAAVVFFYIAQALADFFPLGSGLLCVARTFLLLHIEASGKPADFRSDCKIKYFG